MVVMLYVSSEATTRCSDKFVLDVRIYLVINVELRPNAAAAAAAAAT